jgi:streptogramin lyase
MNVRVAPALLLTALTFALPAVASAAPAVTGEFDMPGGASPGRMTLGSDGNVWALISNNGGGNDVVKITPAGTITPFDVSDVSGAIGITSGPDGNLWVTQSGSIAHFAPATPTAGTKIDVTGLVASDLVFGPDGNIWTTSSDKVEKITTAGVATPTTVAGLAGKGVTVGSDGNIYIADFSGRIIKVTTAGVTTPVTTVFGMQQIAAGPTGQIGYTAPTASPQQVGRLNIATATATPTIVNSGDPTGIVFANDGAYWTANFASNNVSRFTTDGVFTAVPGLKSTSGPRYIVKGAADTLWVAEEAGNAIARISGVSAPPPPPVTPTTPTTTTPTTTPPGATTPTTTPPVLDKTAPKITSLTRPARFKHGKSGTLKISIDENAKLTVAVQRIGAGKRSHGKCVKPTRKLRRAANCTRYIALGSLSKSVVAGANTLRIGPKLRNKTLSAGRYRLIAVAIDAAGNRSAATPATFTIA